MSHSVEAPPGSDVFSRAVRLHQAGDLVGAEQAYRDVIRVDPTHGQAHHFLGLIEEETGRDEAALASIRTAIEITPFVAATYVSLGNLLRRMARIDEAVAALRTATELGPHLPDAHNALGSALWQQTKVNEAAACFRRTLSLRPEHPEAHNNLGIALMEQGRLEEAEASFNRALALRPNDAKATNNLASLLVERQFLDQAIMLYRRAITIEPDYAAAHVNLGITLLAKGELAAGWPIYERRWDVPPMLGTRPAFSQPQWRGEERPGQTLLIYVEQGFGDTIQFCRYAALAARRGLRVVMQVQAPLVRLLRTLDGVADIVSDRDPTPAFDVHCATLSLPLACGTTLQTIPATQRYLRADPAAVAAWQARLVAIGQLGPRVGLVWAGSLRPGIPLMAAVDRRRSIGPGSVAPLIDVPGIHFVSLQKDGPAPGFPITDFMSEMTDFADTAALIEALDLVITVDSAVLHLAAALGKPVWLLNRYDSCWRWFTGRRDSPWYPTLRIYRQPRAGDWSSVIAHVAHDLRQMAQSGPR